MAWTPRGDALRGGSPVGSARMVGQLLQRPAQVSGAMNYALLGINHKSAPVEVREKLAIPESHLPEAMRRLVLHPGVAEAVIISTCNRVELLVRFSSSPPDLYAFLYDFFGVSPKSLF